MYLRADFERCQHGAVPSRAAGACLLYTSRQLRAEGGDAGFWPAPRAAEAVTAKDICTAAQAGDGTAQAIVKESAAYLGMGLSVLIDLFNPERIVIGSIFARAEALFRPGMEAVIAREALAQSCLLYTSRCV